MASVVQHRARSRKRAEYIVSTKTPAQVLRLHAKAEDEFDFVFADELMRALSAAANEPRYALTAAGHAVLAGAAALMLASCGGGTEIPATPAPTTDRAQASMVEAVPRLQRKPDRAPHCAANADSLVAVAQ
jgi:hypothetical protein